MFRVPMTHAATRLMLASKIIQPDMDRSDKSPRTISCAMRYESSFSMTRGRCPSGRRG